MSNIKTTKNNLKSKIEVIKKINDNSSKKINDLKDSFLDKRPISEIISGVKVDGLNNLKKKIDNKNNIFGEIIDVVENFYLENQSVKNTNILTGKNKLKQYALDAAKIALSKSKQIYLDNLQKTLFFGDGICGTETTIKNDSITLSPKEFDFLNVLTINPETATGRIVYEQINSISNKQKVNRELYNIFSGGTYSFISLSNKKLFEASWDIPSQTFVFNKLKQNVGEVKIQDFIFDYYSSIEFPNIDDVLKQAMLLTIYGDKNENNLFNISLNKLERLNKKLLSMCGSRTQKDILKNQNAVELIDETTDEVDVFFNFDDIEGIDLEEETLRLKKVLKFTDCNNFEIESNDLNIEDFSFLINESIEDAVDLTLDKVASDASEQSNSTIPKEMFHISLMNKLILNIPKAIVMSILSPKLFLVPVMLYKMHKNSSVNEVTEYMKKMNKIILNTTRETTWIFIQEFWNLVKVDLLIFVRKFASTVIKNKYKRYITIVQGLLSLLRKIPKNFDINNCYDLFNSILNTLNNSLSIKSPIGVPSFALSFSDRLPGFSQDRALLNISERLERDNISIGPVFGEESNLLKLIKNTVDGITQELDENSFVKISLKTAIIPSGPSGAIIPQGLVEGVGKLF